MSQAKVDRFLEATEGFNRFAAAPARGVLGFLRFMDRVLALGTLRVTGMGSGIEIEVPVAVVASFRDGLMTHFKDYGDKDQALEAVGLRE